MSTDEEAELAQLRHRAYSPSADIASDPDAVRRLVELEARAAADERVPEPAPAAPDEPVGAPEDEIPDAIPELSRFTLPRLRRSTVIMLGAAALVVATLATLLVVVQRVQTDPLQAGATQIARLAPDPTFEVPSSLTTGITGNVTAFEEFEGFRVISQPSYFDAEGAARCMTVWQPELLDRAGGGGFSYDGEFFLTTCGAGSFPANMTMLLREETPERAQTDFPAGTALQFVYDATNNEIVVFRG
ncbi:MULTISPECIES: hypothetical protein [Microbacterium]|jgi:hypothetical protein|uniref:hypothetical protein n=1 Tax=Microbacterium TaxID=33882 RepID=UPI00278381FB|nr:MULTISPECIES: hypothetical protein [Microbacterium]MDQ1076309.1 hypothetical protein [Microbacterium sp. SORGH_AS_0969]MDQ1116546.1 hypothetical protein [Microbacterium testaceum]